MAKRRTRKGGTVRSPIGPKGWHKVYSAKDTSNATLSSVHEDEIIAGRLRHALLHPHSADSVLVGAETVQVLLQCVVLEGWSFKTYPPGKGLVFARI
jgi:hypothetical protein